MDFPAANQHQGVEKSGFLNKLSGRSFPYIPQWKRRYCVLSRGKLYYYEREDSKPGDKSTGVLNLEYFDQVAEAGPKECKKATNVFLLTSQDKSFFDPGRHLFSADTLTDMNDWVRKLQSALDSIRRNKRHLTSDHPAKAGTGTGGGNRKKDDREEKENLSNSSKDRKKRKKEEDLKKKRKTQGVTSETQTRPGSEDHPDGGGSTFKPQRESGGGGGHPGGMVNLAGLGRRLDGGGGSSTVIVDEEPTTRQQLENITKHRVKGPSGRRAPQNRRTVIAAKHRASSLSALEFESLNDNRSEPCSPSATSTSTTTTASSTTTTITTSTSFSSSITATQEQSSTTDTITSNSTTTQVSSSTNTTTTSTTTSTSENITLSPPLTPRSRTSSSRQSPTIAVEYDHDDVESDLFFSDLRRKVRISVDNNLDEDEGKRKSETLDKELKRRSTLKVDFADQSDSERRSRSRSKSRMPSFAKLSRFRDTLSSYRKERYVSKDVIEPSHPDAKTEDNWSSPCTVL